MFFIEKESGEITQLSTQFWAINYIIPRVDDVVIIGVNKTERALKAFIYNPQTKLINEVKTELDFNCKMARYNSLNNKLLLVGTSLKQQDEIYDNFLMRWEVMQGIEILLIRMYMN